MTNQRNARDRTRRGLRKFAAGLLTTAIIAGAVAGAALPANAAEAAPNWDSPWLAGAPVYEGDAPALLAGGLVVDRDFNEYRPSNSLTVPHMEQSVSPYEPTIAMSSDGRTILTTVAQTATCCTTGKFEWDLDAVMLSRDGGDTWSNENSLGIGAWSTAVSPDGSHLIVTGRQIDDPSFAQVYTPMTYTADDGGAWVQHLGAAPFEGTSSEGSMGIQLSIADDARTLVAVDSVTQTAGDGAHSVSVSTDGGLSWANRATATPSAWVSAAISPDGRVISAVSSEGLSDPVIAFHRSIDGGVTWSDAPVPAVAGLGTWIKDLAVSADTRSAVVAFSDHTLLTRDSGATWTEFTTKAGLSVGLGSVAIPRGGSMPDPGTYWATERPLNWMYNAFDQGVTGNDWFMGTTVSRSSEVTGDGLTVVSSLGIYSLERTRTTTVRIGPGIPPAVTPTIDSITPNSGPLVGGGTVTLIGGGFDSCSVAQIDGAAVATLFVDATKLTFIAPAASVPGLVEVSVASGCGVPTSDWVAYTYLADPPVVTDPPVVIGDPTGHGDPTVNAHVREDSPVLEDVTQPVVKAFEAQTSAEEPTANRFRTVGLIMILGGLLALGAVVVHRREKVAA
jgi:hypothetical protein